MGYVLLHSGQPSAKRLLNRIPLLTSAEHANLLHRRDIVIRWGNLESFDTLEPGLNHLRALDAIKTKPRRLQLLRIGGLRTHYGKIESLVKIQKRYRVFIFDSQVLLVQSLEGQLIWLNGKKAPQVADWNTVGESDDRFYNRVVRHATRSLYTLGLDFGTVDVAVSNKGLSYILDVDATPVLKDETLDRFAKAIQDWIEGDMVAFQSNRFPSSFLMGTDLEFMLRNPKSQMVAASKFLSKNGEVGCDARSIRTGPIRYPLAEVRPKPASNPRDLMKNLRATLEVAGKKITRPDLQWVAGSMPFPNYWTGGHIHFSGVPLTNRLIRALDNYLALPIMLIENRATAIKRRPRYGFLGDVRVKSHGGFEYRTLGSWMVSPEIAQAVLALAYVVIVHHRELRRIPLMDGQMQQAFYQGNKAVMRPIFDAIWSDLRATDTFHEYRRELEPIEWMVITGEQWNEQVDVKKVWGVVVDTPKAPARRRKKLNRGRLVAGTVPFWEWQVSVDSLEYGGRG